MNDNVFIIALKIFILVYNIEEFCSMNVFIFLFSKFLLKILKS